MDMLELSAHFSAGEFDVVLDKCTLDALLVDEGDCWDPKQSVRDQVDQVLSGVSQILHPTTGRYLQFSFGQPIHRLHNYFEKEKYKWEVEVKHWGAERGFGYFFYIMSLTSDSVRLHDLYEQKRLVAEEEQRRIREYEEAQRKAYETDSSDTDETKMMSMNIGGSDDEEEDEEREANNNNKKQ